MSLINNNKSFILDEDENKDKEPYELPHIVTSKPEVIPIKNSFIISTALHPTVVALIWLISIMLALAGIKLDLFSKPKTQPKRDIEFVLVDKPGTPRDPNTRNRADINSRSGGKNDPTRKVSMPSPASNKAKKPSAAAASANKIIKKQQQAVQKQIKKQTQPQAPKTAVTQPKAQPAPSVKPSQAKPAPPTARPSARPVSTPAPVAKPTTPFTVPAPKGAPVGKTLSTGPIGGSSTAGAVKSSGGSGRPSSAGTYAPRPSLSPSAGGGGGQLSRGSAPGGTGNVGNPGGGGGAPGIDALREPDFGPYMR